MSYGHGSYHGGSSLGSSIMSTIFFVVLICAIGSSQQCTFKRSVKW